MSLHRPLLGSRAALLGLAGVGSLLLLALLAPLLAPWDPNQVNLAPAFQAPSADFPLGTDAVGRDCLSRLLWGARVSLSLGLLAVLIASVLGSVLGVVAGLAGGLTDDLLCWSADLVLALPRLVLLLAVMALFREADQGRFLLVATVLGLTGWMPVTRIVRSQTLSLRQRSFVQALRALGLPRSRIALRHVLPHALAPVFVHAALMVGGTILTEAGLSFLGLGVPAPTASWGGMIGAGMQQPQHWWLTVFPGLAIVVAVTCFNLLGDGLRDALDPRSEHPSP